MLEIRFAPLKCEMLLLETINSKPSFVLGGGQFDEVDRFGYFGSCISPGVSRSDEVYSRMQRLCRDLLIEACVMSA